MSLLQKWSQLTRFINAHRGLCSFLIGGEHLCFSNRTSLISLSNAKPQLFLWEEGDACQSENPSQLIPKAPGISWFPDSYIVYMWRRNSGSGLNLPRCYRPAKISPGANREEKNLLTESVSMSGFFFSIDLGFGQHSHIKTKVKTNEIHGRAPRHKPQHPGDPWEQKHLPAGKQRPHCLCQADVPSYGCACQNILIHPLELSTCVFEVFEHLMTLRRHQHPGRLCWRICSQLHKFFANCLLKNFTIAHCSATTHGTDLLMALTPGHPQIFRKSRKCVCIGGWWPLEGAVGQSSWSSTIQLLYIS